MTCKRGDLVLVPFPFTDLSSAKQRPVLVLSDPDGYGDFLAVAVTTRSHHTNAVFIGAPDLDSGGLPSPSWVRTDRVMTLNAVLARKVFGSVRGDFLDGVIRRVCERVGLVAAIIPPDAGEAGLPAA